MHGIHRDKAEDQKAQVKAFFFKLILLKPSDASHASVANSLCFTKP